MASSTSTSLSFVTRLALREMRASWRRLLFFFLGVSVGVAAMVTVRSLVSGVRDALGREARSFSAADIVVRSNRPWNAENEAALARGLEPAPDTARSATISTVSMARPGAGGQAQARVVVVRGVDAAFPFYGTVELAGGHAYEHGLLAQGGVLVAPELQAQFNLRVGDSLLIGDHPFTVRGVVLKEPGRPPSPFSIGPRLLVDHAELVTSGLLGHGARARYEVLLRVPEAHMAPLVKRLETGFKDTYVSVRTYRSAGSRLGDGLARAERYLGLVAFVILILGGIGVSSVVRVFILEKLKSIAILKCVGARGHQVIMAYLLQVLTLGLAGSLFGALVAQAVLNFIPAELPGVGRLELHVGGDAVLHGLAVGTLVALLFSLVPLLDVRHVKPLLLLRDEGAPPGRARDPVRGLVAGCGAAALVALASWQAGSVSVALWTLGGFVVLGLALHLLGLLLVRGAALLGRRFRFPVRQALLRLGRPGSQARPVLLSVGLGSFFMLTVVGLQSDLMAQFALELQEDSPDLFLIDVQRDQVDDVRSFLASAGVHEPRLLPVVRARVTGVRGRDVNLDSYDDVRGRGSLGREYVVTWRERLEANESVIDGRFWDPEPARTPEVSIEKSLLRRFGIQVGDEVRFDVLGREITARVTSVRDVAWGDARNGGFMFLFRPGSLEGAPVTYLGFVKGPHAAAERGRLVAALTARFPNVSAVDLRDVLAGLQQIVRYTSFAISVVGFVTLLSGALILVGSVAVTRYQRRYEAAILRTLGARSRSVAALLAMEYAVLGTLAGSVGAVGALVLTAAVARQVLEIRWNPALGTSALGVAVTAVAVMAVGTLTNLDVLRRKPLAVLKAE